MNTKLKNLEPKTIESADAISSQILKNIKNKLGSIPNMYSLMANNSALLEGYISGYMSFRANSGFSPQEQEVIFLSIAFENGCEYCMAGHSFAGDYITNVPNEVINAIRNDTEIPNEKLKALSLFSRVMTSKRGLPTESDINDFINAGYSEKHILGVIAGIGIKTMSNYFNHIFDTPLDDIFKSRVWKRK